MKKIFTTALLSIMIVTTCYIPTKAALVEPRTDLKSNVSKANPQKDLKSNTESFLKLTPKKYQELTGKKLTFKQVLQLKAAQKKLKHQLNSGGQKFDAGVFILLAIFGWAWILMGVSDDWTGSKWVTNLILTLLCWLPGVIHSFVHMKEYTK